MYSFIEVELFMQIWSHFSLFFFLQFSTCHATVLVEESHIIEVSKGLTIPQVTINQESYIICHSIIPTIKVIIIIIVVRLPPPLTKKMKPQI